MSGSSARTVVGHDRSLAFLEGKGEIATAMRARDWRETPVGAPESWPSSLRTILQILLSSRYAMWMAWGPELTFFCNDAYRPTLGVKKDWLGAPAARVWEEVWADLFPRIDYVLRTGEATWDKALMLVLERSGFPEETYHTFSYSPLADDAGSINGMLCVVTEETDRVIGERRLHVLRDLALRISNGRTSSHVWDSVRACLDADSRDLPVVVAYAFDEDGKPERKIASGLAEGHFDAMPSWPLRPIREGQRQIIVGDLPALPSTAWDRPCADALVLPIASPARGTPDGVFVAGLNPYRTLDADYRGFIDLFVGQIAAGLGAASAFEAERERAEALAAVDREKTAFFSNVSHEFRTPLTLMLGPLEDALIEAGQSLEQQKRLEVALRNGQRLLRLVNVLLDFSRIESGRAQATYRPTDLAKLTSELASAFRSATDKAGIALRVDCPPLDQPVFVDRDMWEMVVLNLLSNAFKFTFDGAIDVALRPHGDQTVRLTVRDTGTGIPADELPRIFERFHRVEGARGRSFEGSGIGLALVQELVKQHGGDITVDSEMGRGTTFRVDLRLGTAHLSCDRVKDPKDFESSPARGQSYVEEALRWLPFQQDDRTVDGLGNDRSTPTTASNDADGGRQRVLIADDNADLRHYIARLLAEGGYEAETVDDGLAALDRIRDSRPDLLIADVMMPRLDGFGLLAAIRGDATIRELPVVMLSARAGEEARIEGLSAGADDYLIKPFSARELLARVGGTMSLAKLRRDASETLRATEARSAAVLEGMAEGYVLLDADFRVLQVNTEALRHDGGVASEVIGRRYWDVWPDLDRSTRAEALERAMAERTPVTLDDYRETSDGHDAWVEVRAYPSGDGLALFMHDITDRKRAERELQGLNENLEQQVEQRTRERDRTWNNSPDLLLIVDGNGIFRAVNPAWTAVLGYAPGELIGHDHVEFIHPDDHPSSRAALAKATVADLPRFENRLRHKDGSYRWISWVASPEGDLVYASGRHVTSEKEAAAELEVAQDQLRQSQKMEAVGQLTGGLAHDFNNLLTGISGSLELLQLRVASGRVGELDRYLNAAQGAARRAAALTHRLLAFSRRQTLDPKPTDVNRLIVDLEDLIRRSVGHAVEIRVVGAPDLWPALVDQNQLENALLNLCINGRDAMPDGGRLTIETANKSLGDRDARERDLPPGEYLSICVTDTGTGMTNEVLQRAFDPFFTTKPLGAGTGLGLSMVYGFARQSGGQVRIFSEVGHGTTVCVYLPRGTHDFGVVDESDHGAPVASEPSAKDRTVLVVDDEPTVRLLVVEVLQAMGFRTLEAEDGTTGLKILASDARIDLLVTDIGLPGGLSGRDVAEAARQLRAGLKVLFITGYADHAVTEHETLQQNTQLLTKPFPIDALSRRVEELLAVQQV